VVLIVYIAFNIMWVILKVSCTGIGLNVITTLCRLLSTLIPTCCHPKAETKARFQHENLRMRLVHSWMCGVVLCDISVPIAGVHAAEWVRQISIVPHQSRTAASWQCWDQAGARETGQVLFLH